MSAHDQTPPPSSQAASTDDAPGNTATSPAPRPRLILLGAAVFALVVAVDQVTKAWALSALGGGRVVPVVGDVMQLRLVRNPGAAFSFATNATWVFTIIACVVLVVVAVTLRRAGSSWWAVALGLLAGGATGNLVDRLLRPPAFARGHVIDFLEWPGFPVFNVADSCVVTAAIMIGIAALRGVGVDGRRHG